MWSRVVLERLTIISEYNVSKELSVEDFVYGIKSRDFSKTISIPGARCDEAGWLKASR